VYVTNLNMYLMDLNMYLMDLRTKDNWYSKGLILLTTFIVQSNK
jgi:hypothetical protein